MTVPVSIRLREHILYAYISKEINICETAINSLKSKLQNVKDVWKWFILPKLEETMKKHADMSTPSPFLIEVSLAYADDEMVFTEL